MSEKESQGEQHDEDFLELTYMVAIEEWRRRTVLGKVLYPWWFLTRAMAWAVALLILCLAHYSKTISSGPNSIGHSSAIYKEEQK